MPSYRRKQKCAPRGNAWDDEYYDGWQATYTLDVTDVVESWEETGILDAAGAMIERQTTAPMLPVGFLAPHFDDEDDSPVTIEEKVRAIVALVTTNAAAQTAAEQAKATEKSARAASREAAEAAADAEYALKTALDALVAKATGLVDPKV
jgi:hypothetical protein